jgi:hypothetical protein
MIDLFTLLSAVVIPVSFGVSRLFAALHLLCAMDTRFFRAHLNMPTPASHGSRVAAPGSGTVWITRFYR